MSKKIKADEEKNLQELDELPEIQEAESPTTSQEEIEKLNQVMKAYFGEATFQKLAALQTTNLQLQKIADSLDKIASCQRWLVEQGKERNQILKDSDEEE